MLVLEHDAKELLAARGVPVPHGELVPISGGEGPDFAPPWVVKAQVPVGGRGKAGGVRAAATAEQLADHLHEMARLSIKGYPVREVRVEQAVGVAAEAYLSFSVDPANATIAVMASASGGVDVEEHASSAMLLAQAEPEAAALETAFAALTPRLPQALRSPLKDAAAKLAPLFLRFEATLLEINPLFVLPDGGWIVGDVRLAIDENALPRQPELSALLQARADAYPDAAFKRAEGYDLVVVDPEGEIGLITTGAGLSMKLIDEMGERGIRPYNFCDIRSGQMRGDPARLIGALRAVAAGRSTRCVLVNIFAGITDLGEFARLLIEALRALPELRLPLVVRLVGNGEEAAEALLRGSGLALTIERDLDRAVERAAVVAGRGHA